MQIEWKMHSIAKFWDVAWEINVSKYIYIRDKCVKFAYKFKNDIIYSANINKTKYCA